MSNNVVMVGGKRLRKELKAGGIDLKDMRDIHMQAARVVSQSAKPATPKVTGALAASVRPGATRTASVIRAGKGTVPYANPIHWGWFRRGIQPQPWLSKAAQRTEPTWLPLFMEELDRIIAQCSGGPR